LEEDKVEYDNDADAIIVSSPASIMLRSMTLMLKRVTFRCGAASAKADTLFVIHLYGSRPLFAFVASCFSLAACLTKLSFIDFSEHDSTLAAICARAFADSSSVAVLAASLARAITDL
jgi:prephenate dehydrogenase